MDFVALVFKSKHDQYLNQIIVVFELKIESLRSAVSLKTDLAKDLFIYFMYIIYQNYSSDTILSKTYCF